MTKFRKPVNYLRQLAAERASRVPVAVPAPVPEDAKKSKKSNPKTNSDNE